MGDEEKLLDDSAIVTAFDQAILKYKKMHGKGYEVCSTTIADFPPNDKSNPETVVDGDKNGSEISVEVREPINLGTVKEYDVTDSQIPKEHELESNGLLPQDQSQSYFTSAEIDEYNQLYKQYYEIEEQRQSIIQKMQKFSSEPYPCPGEASVSGMQWGTYSANQEYQCTSHVPGGTVCVSCSACPCQCSVPSFPSLTCPTASTLDAGPPSTKGLDTKPSLENVDFVTTALGAAEKALSTLMDKTSGSEKENKLCDMVVQNADTETDLSTVLNAWFSAGFYTGKYVTEKSLAKKCHD